MSPDSRTTLLAVLLGLALAGAAAPPAVAAAASRAPRSTVDFGMYQELLNEHLWTVSEADEPFETRFNYELFHDQRGRAERTFRIRRQFLSVDPEQLDRPNRIAWAINFYNFIVLEQITDHLLIPGKTRQRFLSVRDIRPQGQDFFKVKVVKVGDDEYSLDEFEKRFLFDDFDRKPGATPPATIDPRIHFAIVCGAIGCPPLQPRAFRADSLEMQLERSVRQSLASPKHFQHTAGTSSIRISAIFFWYAPDFGGVAKAVRWLVDYLPKAEKAAVTKFVDRPMTSQIVWDWKLNQVVGWRFHYMMDQPIPGAAKDSI